MGINTRELEYGRTKITAPLATAGMSLVSNSLIIVRGYVISGCVVHRVCVIKLLNGDMINNRYHSKITTPYIPHST